MSTRTIQQIESEIQAIKDANPNWITNSGDKALITALTNEKNNLSLPPQGLISVIPQVIVRDRMLPLRVPAGTSFVDLLNTPLPFKIPIQNRQIINLFPAVFELGCAEYEFSVDTWHTHQLLSLTSGQAVVIFDGMWQSVLSNQLLLVLLSIWTNMMFLVRKA